MRACNSYLVSDKDFSFGRIKKCVIVTFKDLQKAVQYLASPDDNKISQRQIQTLLDMGLAATQTRRHQNKRGLLF
jgi:hypothetical protein